MSVIARNEVMLTLNLNVDMAMPSWKMVMLAPMSIPIVHKLKHIN